MAKVVERSKVRRWGDSLALRITSDVARTAGVLEDSQVKITAEPGRLVVETIARRPNLDELLQAFDPARHGGEVMGFDAMGREVI